MILLTMTLLTILIRRRTGFLDDTGQENDNTDTGDGSSDDGSSDQTSSDDTGNDSSDQIDYPSDDNSGDRQMVLG